MTPKWYFPAPVSSWHKEFPQIASMYPRGSQRPPASFWVPLRSVYESDPRSFQIIACALGLRQCENLLMSFRSGPSVFYTPLDLLHTRFTDQMFWELIFPAQDSLVGSLMSSTPHSLGRTSAIVIIFLFVSKLPSYMSLDCIAPPPLSPSYCGSSSISLLWKFFSLWVLRSFSLMIAL